jgi:hypothetical protein
MPDSGNPNSPEYEIGNGGPATPIGKSTLATVDVQNIIAQIKADIPVLRFAYVSVMTYLEVTSKLPTSTIYEHAEVKVKPILDKTTEITDDEAAIILGAFVAVAEQGGKEIIQSFIPLMGADLLKVFTVLGAL